jgi:hypothetical protein
MIQTSEKAVTVMRIWALRRPNATDEQVREMAEVLASALEADPDELYDAAMRVRKEVLADPAVTRARGTVRDRGHVAHRPRDAPGLQPRDRPRSLARRRLEVWR